MDIISLPTLKTFNFLRKYKHCCPFLQTASEFDQISGYYQWLLRTLWWRSGMVDGMIPSKINHHVLGQCGRRKASSQYLTNPSNVTLAESFLSHSWLKSKFTPKNIALPGGMVVVGSHGHDRTIKSVVDPREVSPWWLLAWTVEGTAKQ